MNKLTQIKTWRYTDIQSNHKYSRDTYFYMKNFHTNCEDKKTMGYKTSDLQFTI